MNHQVESRGPLDSSSPEEAELRKHEVHEIYKAIGRNIVLLQQMEGMLRFLAVNANISGSPSELLAQQKQQQKKWKKGGLGELVDDYAKRVLVDAADDKESDGGHFSMSFRMCSSEQASGDRKKLLRRIAAERNKLVHRLPFDWIPGHEEGYGQLRSWLEKLWDELLQEWRLLRQQVLVVREAYRVLVMQLDSDFFDLDENGQREWFRNRGIALNAD